MRRTLIVACIALFAGISIQASDDGGNSSTFERIVPQYETIRLALLDDGLDGVPASARQIETLAAALEHDLAAETAGIRPDGIDELRKVLPSIRAAAGNVAAAESIAEAREAFGELSRALVRYRQLVVDPTPVVAFCSMAQEVWLQPDGEIGNPYYGQSMARCGEIVSQ